MCRGVMRRMSQFGITRAFTINGRSSSSSVRDPPADVRCVWHLTIRATLTSRPAEGLVLSSGNLSTCRDVDNVDASSSAGGSCPATLCLPAAMNYGRSSFFDAS